MQRFCYYTQENARYHLGGKASSEHQNEDRYFTTHEEKFNAFAVFDGHDGPTAANYARGQFQRLVMGIVNNYPEDQISAQLKECFAVVESNFFKTIQVYIDEKRNLQKVIPPVSYYSD